MTIQESLHSFFIICLRNLLNGEKVLKDELTKLAKKASSDDLQSALLHHQKETVEQEKRLLKILNTLENEQAAQDSSTEAGKILIKGKETLKHIGALVFKKENATIETLVEHTKSILNHFTKTDIIDYVIASMCQLIEQVEIVEYKTTLTIAELFEFKQAIPLLKHTLKEEESAFNQLTKIAQKETAALGMLT